MKRAKYWYPIIALAAALVIWAVVFALGAYLEPSADKPRHDLRKPLIILAAMGLFLSFWGLALWLRARRKPPGT
jgi:membrane protein DedA with SNARE-associated domain